MREIEDGDPEPGADGWIRWQASLCMSWGWSLLLIATKNEVTRICSPSQQQDEEKFSKLNREIPILGRMGVFSCVRCLIEIFRERDLNRAGAEHSAPCSYCVFVLKFHYLKI